MFSSSHSNALASVVAPTLSVAFRVRVTQLAENLVQVNTALQGFVGEMRTMGVWDHMAIAQVSDFGRTLTSNSLGTDHAWGGHTFLLGGNLDGGKILGNYPQMLNLAGNPLNAGRTHQPGIPTSRPFSNAWPTRGHTTTHPRPQVAA